MNMLSDRRGEVAVLNLFFLGLLVLMSIVTAYFIINLSVHKTLFLFVTGLLCIFSFANVNLGLFFIVILMLFPNFMPGQMFGIVGINPFNLIFAVVVGVVALRIIVRRSSLRFHEPIYLPLLILFLLQGIAMIRYQGAVNVSTLDNTLWLIRYFKPLQYIILVVLLVNFVRTREAPFLSVIMLLGFLAAGGILFYEWFIYGFAMGKDMSKNIAHILWSNPLIGHKVNWGILFTLAFFFVLAMMRQRFPNWNFALKVLVPLSLILITFLIAISLARVAYFCIIIGLVYFYWTRGRLQLIGVLIFLAILVAVMPEIIRMRAVENIPTAWHIDTLDRFLAGRLQSLWIPAFRAFIENPLFGKGVNGAGIYILGQGRTIFPHSGYVATLCDMGIIGLIVMVWLFAAFWKHCSLIYNRTRNDLTRRLALACKAQILVLAFSNLTSDHSFLYQPIVVAPFFLSVAMLFALYRNELAQIEVERPTLQKEEAIFALSG